MRNTNLTWKAKPRSVESTGCTWCNTIAFCISIKMTLFNFGQNHGMVLFQKYGRNVTWDIGNCCTFLENCLKVLSIRELQMRCINAIIALLLTLSRAASGAFSSEFVYTHWLQEPQLKTSRKNTRKTESEILFLIVTSWFYKSIFIILIDTPTWCLWILHIMQRTEQDQNRTLRDEINVKVPVNILPLNLSSTF
jgi:hypothetical protein